MRALSVFLFFAMAMAGFLAFGDVSRHYPTYYNTVSIAPYQFANFLFWIFLLLFFAAILSSSTNGRRSPSRQEAQSAREMKAHEETISGGFTLALFLVVIALTSGVFGFGVIASAIAGLAMVVFWIAVAVAVVAIFAGFYDRRPPRMH